MNCTPKVGFEKRPLSLVVRLPETTTFVKCVLFVSFAERTRATGVGKWTHEVADVLNAKGYTVTLWFSDNFPYLRKRRRSGRQSASTRSERRQARRSMSGGGVGGKTGPRDSRTPATSPGKATPVSRSR